jgi:hypothetical protein
MFHATGLTGWQRAEMAATGPAAEKAEEAGAGSAAPDAPAGGLQELAMLRQQADGLATALDQIRQRIEEIQRQWPASEPVAEQAAG